MEKNAAGPLANTVCKNQSKWIKALNVKDKSRRKHRAKLHDSGFGSDFWDMTLKAQATRENR